MDASWFHEGSHRTYYKEKFGPIFDGYIRSQSPKYAGIREKHWKAMVIHLDSSMQRTDRIEIRHGRLFHRAFIVTDIFMLFLDDQSTFFILVTLDFGGHFASIFGHERDPML